MIKEYYIIKYRAGTGDRTWFDYGQEFDTLDAAKAKVADLKLHPYRIYLMIRELIAGDENDH